MKGRAFLVITMFAIACGGFATTTAQATQQTGAAKAAPNPSAAADAAAMADFKTRVESYAALHKRLAKGPAAQKKNANPDKLTAQKTTLAARIQAARADAKHGDIFTPEVRETFRRLLAPGLKGAGGRDTKAVIKDDAPAPGTVPFKVNAKYPDNQPKPTMPANLLLKLPRLPEPLQYRVVGQHLLLLDTAADMMIVDYILNAIAT
jgi:hypothetical protein